MPTRRASTPLLVLAIVLICVNLAGVTDARALLLGSATNPAPTAAAAAAAAQAAAVQAAAVGLPVSRAANNATTGAGGRRQLLQTGAAVRLARGSGRVWLLYPSAALSFIDARQACQALGGDLLTVSSAADAAALTAAMSSFTSSSSATSSQGMWIGLTSRSGVPTSSRAGWMWVASSATPSYDGWGAGQPDLADASEGVCAAQWASSGAWNDTDCSLELSFSCELQQCQSAPLTQPGAVPFAATSLPADPFTAVTAACDIAFSGYGRTATCRAGQWSYSGACQRDAVGNSDACRANIPKCEAGACASRNVRGDAKAVCLRCLSNYMSVLDDSLNIVQCVCPPGFYESSPNATSCSRCPVNSICPGGDMVENPLSRGARTECGNNLVTRSSGARSRSECVAPAGHCMASPFAAVPCGQSEFAPALNRLPTCLKCATGLVEDPALGLTPPQRSNKKTVCKVPPGKYMQDMATRPCPQGFYREAFLNYDDAFATKCLPCNPGITTSGAGAVSPSLCNVVLPGYGIDVLYNVSTIGGGAAKVPALPSPATGLPAASVCEYGFYSSGGYCVQCPGATATQNRGSIGMESCVVPPGYAIKNGVMAPCVAGEFRPEWVLLSDPAAAACLLCGDEISSEPRNMDENPMVVNGSLARATSDSCYIEAGMGMIGIGNGQYVAQDCPINTYGAAGRVYGLISTPCKPCPRSLITDGATRVNNSDTCVNDDGWGYASDGASRCAPGFYALKGTRKPCQQCPAGRTTLDNSAFQRTIEDCRVAAGHGIVRSANTSDPWDVDAQGLTAAQLAVLLVMECPKGSYGPGDSVGGKCLKCEDGTSTLATGARSAAECAVCSPGYGKPDNSSTSKCELCPLGSFQPGDKVQCQACPDATFYAPVDGAGATYTSAATSLYKGAVRVEDCVPQRSQLSPEAGQAFFAPDSPLQPLLAATQQPDLTACLAACAGDACCLAQWDAPTRNCRIASLAPDAADAPSGLQLLYKLPPAGPAAAVLSLKGNRSSRVRARSLSSGWYATCAVPAAQAAAWQALGAGLGRDARTFSTNGAEWDVATSRAACKAKCDDSNVCWGFLFDAANSSCLFRGGVDALASRAFFVLPTSVDLAAIKWGGGGGGGSSP